MSEDRRRVCVLISGRGSNLEALLQATKAPGYPATIVGVISDTVEAGGLAVAAANGVATRVVSRADFASREAHDQAIDATLHAFGAEIVCLAGYMRMLGSALVEEWTGRMINIHPSLLPLFRGLDTHRRALDAGVGLHGCTVHFVSSEMDAGAIIGQAAVPVLPGDTEQRLAARVLGAEHRLYPLALGLLASGKVRLDADRAVFTTPPAPTAGGAVLSSLDFVAPIVDVEALARFTP